VKIIIAVIMFLYVFSTQAQVAKSSVLYKTLKLKDSIIFERTFNLCETEKLEPIIATNFEFYHDVGGIQNREEFIKAVKNNICINPGNFTRQLVANSLEVFPLKKNGILYGAIQRGKHTFQEKNNGEMKTVGIARFTHVWILENKKWKLKRVLSFDHNPYSE
jgi:hypothetical protein